MADDFEIPDVSGYRIENWSEEEREMWCGEYTDAQRAAIRLGIVRAAYVLLSPGRSS